MDYKIIKIHTTRFTFEDLEEGHVHELFSTPQNLGFSMTMGIIFNLKASVLTIHIDTKLIEKENNNSLIDHSARTSYAIRELNRFVHIKDKKERTYHIPEELLVELFSTAYTHARALLATEISPTIYKDKYFLPVIDPADVIKKQELKHSLGRG